MKKLLCLLLPLILLLTGCGGNNVPTQNTTDPTTESLSDITESLSTIPTFPDSSVHTDFSVYASKDSALKNLFIRPSQPVDLPLSQPTTLYPYGGSLLRNAFGYTDIDNKLFGLVDATGTLILEPVYHSISPVYDSNRGEYLPFWHLTQTEAETVFWESGESYTDAKYTHGLVSMDGTIAFDCIYSHLSVEDGRILCSREDPDGNIILEAYDTDGTLRFSFQGPSSGTRKLSPYYSYGEDLYVIHYYEENGDSFAYYVDEEGQQVFGPFTYADPFHDGLASVSTTDNTSVFLRKDGSFLPGNFHYVNSFRNGVAFVYDSNWNTALIDTQGEAIIPATYSISETALRDGYFTQNINGNAIQVYDRNGNFLWETTDLYANILSTELYHYTDSDNLTILKNVSTGKTLTFQEDGYVNYYPTPTGLYLTFKEFSYDQPFRTVHIITEDLDIFETKELSYANPENVLCYPDYTEGFSVREGNQVTLYRGPGDPVGTYTLEPFYKAFVYPDGSVAFETETCTEIYNAQGNLIFRYTINLMDD